LAEKERKKSEKRRKEQEEKEEKRRKEQEKEEVVEFQLVEDLRYFIFQLKNTLSKKGREYVHF
jgi:hypothetical protein